jgi:hypothetical protein
MKSPWSSNCAPRVFASSVRLQYNGWSCEARPRIVPLLAQRGRLNFVVGVCERQQR